MAAVKDIDKGFQHLVNRLQFDGQEVRVGITAASGSAAAQGEDSLKNLTVLDIAEFHEFGTGTIPERSFIRAWFDENRDLVRKQITNILQAVVKGKYTRDQALNILGLTWAAGMQKRMADRIPPELSPATIKAKGSDVPLIDTGQLRSAITYSVKK